MIIYEYPGTTYTYFDNDLYKILKILSQSSPAVRGAWGAEAELHLEYGASPQGSSTPGPAV
jgi:hypothetical protein